jgi:hypothetical protein
VKGGDCSCGNSRGKPNRSIYFNMMKGQCIMDIPIKKDFTLYQHQVDAFTFACRLLGVPEGGDEPPISKGVAYLMEMG